MICGVSNNWVNNPIFDHPSAFRGFSLRPTHNLRAVSASRSGLRKFCRDQRSFAHQTQLRHSGYIVHDSTYPPPRFDGDQRFIQTFLAKDFASRDNVQRRIAFHTQSCLASPCMTQISLTIHVASAHSARHPVVTRWFLAAVHTYPVLFALVVGVFPSLFDLLEVLRV